MTLPIISCDDCGKCCKTIGTPPFLGFEIFELPESLRSEVINWMNNDQEREYSNLPCYWFDQATLKCINYEHRPALCRDFEVGSDSCIKFREFT